MNAATKAKLESNLGDAPVVEKEKRVLIVLQDNDNIPPTGQYIGLNGRNWHLRPGEEALVPIGVCEILDNAVELAAIKDGSQRIIGHRNRMRFPYTVVRAREAVEA